MRFQRRSGGFTLVELLVVIGIIALLISILLPALTRVKESANRTLCLNNHKQLYAAIAMYCTDNKQIVPFCNWIAQEGTGGNQFNGAGWLYDYRQKNNPGFPKIWDNSGKYFISAQGGAIWKYLKSDKVFHCPFDVEPWKTNTAGQIDTVHPATSYGMNGAVNAFGRVIGGRVPFFKVQQFKPHAWLLWELDETYNTVNGGTTIWNDGSNFPREGITARHGSKGLANKKAAGGIVTRFDGSVVWITMDQYEQDWKKTEATDIPGSLYCVPTSVSRSGGYRTPPN